jgi:hypothetical protein
MKKAIKDSKWWFYIPIISMLFMSKITCWIFDGKTTLERQWRSILILYSTIIHAVPIVGIMTYFTNH